MGFQESFNPISAWCEDLAPKGANLTGLIHRFLRYGSASQRIFREGLDQSLLGVGI